MVPNRTLPDQILPALHLLLLSHRSGYIAYCLLRLMGIQTNPCSPPLTYSIVTLSLILLTGDPLMI